MLAVLCSYVTFSAPTNHRTYRRSSNTQRPIQRERSALKTPTPHFETKVQSPEPDSTAPDGSYVRLMLRLDRGSMAHFELPPGETSAAVMHRTVEEIWYFLSGCGEMWRKLNDQEEVVKVEAGVCITIPLGTHFQFRAFGDEPLAVVGVTMPPWPGEDEAVVVAGKWEPTVL